MLTVLTALQKCFPAFNLILMIEYRFTDTGIHERRNKMKKFAALIAVAEEKPIRALTRKQLRKSEIPEG